MLEIKEAHYRLKNGLAQMLIKVLISFGNLSMSDSPTNMLFGCCFSANQAELLGNQFSEEGNSPNDPFLRKKPPGKEKVPYTVAGQTVVSQHEVPLPV